MKIFAIYDSKAEAYHQPFFQNTVGLAIRAFTTAANDESSAFHAHSGDYSLFEIGEFDERSGKITGLSAFNNFGTALQYREDKGIRQLSSQERQQVLIDNGALRPVQGGE